MDLLAEWKAAADWGAKINKTLCYGIPRLMDIAVGQWQCPVARAWFFRSFLQDNSWITGRGMIWVKADVRRDG
jgi:hypothetical protein